MMQNWLINCCDKNISILGVPIWSKKETDARVEYKILGLSFKIRKQDKCIAVISLKGLGDYIIMHNFLSYIKQSKKYKTHKLVVITWSHFSSLAESIDSSYVDEFILLDSIWRKPWGIKYLKKKFSRYNFNAILSPVASNIFDDERIISLIKSKNVIGQECIENEARSRNKKLYTELIECSPELITEFERYKNFFENVLNLKINIEKPSFEYNFETDEKYIFFSPFAGHPNRTWCKEKFANIINYIIEKYNLKCVILGSKFDFNDAQKIISSIKRENLEKVINAVGKIATVDLPKILKRNAKLLIGNETGTIHIAHAVNCPFLVICNACFYKRFQPYKGFEQAYIYPPKFRDLLKNDEDVSRYYYKTDLDINDISEEDVKTKIDSLLNTTN